MTEHDWADLYDATACDLGEGVLWHPERHQLFWFDILSRRLLTKEGGRVRDWTFDEDVSAGAWVDGTTLLIASETRLFTFDVESGRREDVVALEADDPKTRSNDGRADPWGGFWIGTMGKLEEDGLGAFWRYYRGELRRIETGVSITNALAFDRARGVGYRADTPTNVISRFPVDPETGWPAGDPEPWLDTSGDAGHPDGAMCDADGNVWNARWGGGRVICYSPDGEKLREVEILGRNASCPALGGDDMTTLFVTSARRGNPADDPLDPPNGMTFAIEGVANGRPEPQVIL